MKVYSLSLRLIDGYLTMWDKIRKGDKTSWRTRYQYNKLLSFQDPISWGTYTWSYFKWSWGSWWKYRSVHTDEQISIVSNEKHHVHGSSRVPARHQWRSSQTLHITPIIAHFIWIYHAAYITHSCRVLKRSNKFTLLRNLMKEVCAAAHNKT